jgi:hypothetical protein
MAATLNHFAETSSQPPHDRIKTPTVVTIPNAKLYAQPAQGHRQRGSVWGLDVPSLFVGQSGSPHRQIQSNALIARSSKLRYSVCGESAGAQWTRRWQPTISSNEPMVIEMMHYLLTANKAKGEVMSNSMPQLAVWRRSNTPSAR